MKRRQFLHGLLGAGSVVAGNCIFRNPIIQAAHAQSVPPVNPTLIVIFQRGGCDGLNMIPPIGDTGYIPLRPTIYIPTPESNEVFPALPLADRLGNQPAPTGTGTFFGLQPSLSPLLDIYDNGNMAILPTVQYDNATRSHFAGQHRIESGAPVDDIDGWLNRHIQVAGLSGQLQAVHYGSSLAQALRGDIPVQSFNSINNFNLGLGSGDEVALTNAVLPVYNNAPSPATAYETLVHQYGQVLFNNLNVVQNITLPPPVVDPLFPYPSNGYGNQLRELAGLIKSNVGLQAATVNIGGWDTHSNQGNGDPAGRQSRSFGSFAGGIRALVNDLGPLMDQTVILTMSEFGRTSLENGSRGTDHGNAAVWTVISSLIQGGLYGTWPGLDPATQLYQGRYLQHTVDFRNIMGDILTNLFGHTNGNLATLLPGHSYGSMNLFGQDNVVSV
jgi:uncharacterized protein (DUF1501 family)